MVLCVCTQYTSVECQHNGLQLFPQLQKSDWRVVNGDYTASKDDCGKITVKISDSDNIISVGCVALIPFLLMRIKFLSSSKGS